MSTVFHLQHFFGLRISFFYTHTLTLTCTQACTYEYIRLCVFYPACPLRLLISLLILIIPCVLLCSRFFPNFAHNLLSVKQEPSPLQFPKLSLWGPFQIHYILNNTFDIKLLKTRSVRHAFYRNKLLFYFMQRRHAYIWHFSIIMKIIP